VTDASYSPVGKDINWTQTNVHLETAVRVPVFGGHAADYMYRMTKHGRATGLFYEFCSWFSSILEHMRRSYQNFTLYCILLT